MMNVNLTTSSTVLNRYDPGSAGASPAVSGASPETSDHIRYSKRRLPHFERPWAKYAVVFSTRERHQLTEAERDIVLESILYASRHAQYELFVACVMLDHVHLLFEPQPKERGSEGEPTFWSLTEILQGIKSTTAHRINKVRRATGAIWESESFDRLIRSERDFHEKFRYICRNPWESKVIGTDEEYPWLWTAEIGSAEAPNRAGEAPALPGTRRSHRRQHSPR
jgi:putative transposase